MKNAFELLMNAPESQITRAPIAYKAILQGEMSEALYTYDCAICEYGTSQPWSLEVMELYKNIKKNQKK